MRKGKGKRIMKYALWGMGQNGLELYSMLPKEDICAIIDRDKDSVFIKAMNLTVITFEEYLGQRSQLPEHLIVICPFKYYSMEKLLQDNRITNYSILKKSTVGMLAYASVLDGTYQDKMQLIRGQKYFLTKNGFFQDVLYEKMTADGFSVMWVEKECDQTPLFEEENINQQYYQEYNTRLSRLRNTFEDVPVFVIGCGPSLRASDLDILSEHKCITFGVNDIYYIFRQTKWRPDYYFASDRRQLIKYEEEPEFYDAVKPLKKIFSDNYIPVMQREKNDESTYFFRQIQDLAQMGFSTDCCSGVYCSNTVIFGALQFAVYMGAKNIYLLGCDNGIAPGKKLYFYEDKMLNENIDTWEKIALEAYSDMEIGYRVAKRETEKIGVNIYNATRGGYLEVFERVNFDSLF